jgi:hypothetical protein
MLGKHYLCAVVTQEERNWPTPAAMEAEKAGLYDKGQMGNSLSAMARRGELHGQAAPASSSSFGSHQGLWPTARSLDGSVNESLETWTARHHRKEAEGINLHRPLPIAVLQEQNKQLWPTITAHTPDMESNGPNGHSGTYLAGAVKKQWATPQASDPEHSGPNQRDSSGRPALPAQALQWATPRPPNGGQTTSGAEDKQTKKQVLLQHQANGKLNPRWVETLMGLPIGWTMPSCIRPVTIAPTNSDSSVTGSSQQLPSELF